MAGGLLAGLSRSIGAGGAARMAGASKMYGASKGIGLMPKTFRGSLVRGNLLSPSGGGGGVSASNFTSSSIRNTIGNISNPISSGSGGGVSSMLTSEKIRGRKTVEDTTQDFLDTFGSDKRGKDIRKTLMVLRDTFVETFETARILRTALNQMDGIGGGKGKNKDPRSPLQKFLSSPVGMLTAGGAGAGGVMGLSKLFGKKKPAIKPKPKVTVNNTTNAIETGKKATKNFTKNISNVTDSAKTGVKKSGLIKKGIGSIIKNPKRAIGAGILGIGGLIAGGLGVKSMFKGNNDQDLMTKFDGAIDKWNESLDNQGSSSDGGDDTGVKTSKNVIEDGNKSTKPQGLLRGIGGALDFATAGMFDFDKQNREGAPKDFGIRRIAGGLADSATLGLTDFDKRGKGNLQFDPISGGKDKAWGAGNEQRKRREKQSGFGLKRGIGGALDFATLGMFDFDKRNTSGAPKGFGLKRIMGGVADAITAGATDFDKRGTGIGQMNLGEKMRRKKRREAFENNPRVKNFREQQLAGKTQSKEFNRVINSLPDSKKQEYLDFQKERIRVGKIHGRNSDEYENVVNKIKSFKSGITKGNVKLNAQNTSVPKSVKKTPKVINVPSAGVPSGGNNTGSGGGSVQTSGSSGGGPSIAFPPSHNGVSYAAVETQSYMNLVMAD